jgi:hypothetical protein
MPLQLVWWILWVGILNGLMLIYYFIGRNEPSPGVAESLVNFTGLVPLAASVSARWLVLARVRQRQLAFVIFVVGLALADGAGVLAIFLGGPHKKEVFTLALLGVLQWAPVFAGRFGSDGPGPSQG